MPSLASWLAQGTAVSTFSAIAGFFVYTKHCHFTPESQLDRSRDPLFTGKWARKLNAVPGNQVLLDECVRRMPVWKVRRDLVEDAEKGGTKLIEEFTGGIWGGLGYTIQRHYLAAKYRNDTTTAHQLWNKPDLLSSTYNPGTQITDHFAVLEKTPTSVLIRCGDSPLKGITAFPSQSQPGSISTTGELPLDSISPRASDGLFEITAHPDFEKGYVEFRLKSLFFQGVGKSEGKPLGGKAGLEEWAHRQYTKLWMETAVGRCLTLT